MSYLDTYFSRLNHLGNTTAERIRNAGIRSFEKWMAESPFTVRNLSTENGIYFSGIIQTNKDKEYEKIMFLYVANDIPIEVGNIMNWTLDNGSIEKWLLIQDVKKTNGICRTFWIVRCNYLLKWIDAQGHLQQSWAYAVSSVDSKIKGNYRTWNNLITPQPNKYAEILMPRYPIDRATNFIIEDESWQVIEYDHTSVPGTIYLSLTENKINLIYDDTENNIADLDKLAKYSLLLPEKTQVFSVGSEINPVFTLVKNGKPHSEEYNLLSADVQYTRVIDGVLTAIASGETQILVQLKNYPDIKIPMTIQVSDESQEFSAYIDGPNTIKLDRYATFALKGTSTIEGSNIVYTVSNAELATIFKIDENFNCVIHANDKNKLGTLTITAVYDGNEYTKEINIVPIW